MNFGDFPLIKSLRLGADGANDVSGSFLNIGARSGNVSFVRFFVEIARIEFVEFDRVFKSGFVFSGLSDLSTFFPLLVDSRVLLLFRTEMVFEFGSKSIGCFSVFFSPPAS